MNKKKTTNKYKIVNIGWECVYVLLPLSFLFIFHRLTFKMILMLWKVEWIQNDNDDDDDVDKSRKISSTIWSFFLFFSFAKFETEKTSLFWNSLFYRKNMHDQWKKKNWNLSICAVNPFILNENGLAFKRPHRNDNTLYW